MVTARKVPARNGSAAKWAQPLTRRQPAEDGVQLLDVTDVHVEPLGTTLRPRFCDRACTNRFNYMQVRTAAPDDGSPAKVSRNQPASAMSQDKKRRDNRCNRVDATLTDTPETRYNYPSRNACKNWGARDSWKYAAARAHT